jgi:hypothetical protein
LTFSAVAAEAIARRAAANEATDRMRQGFFIVLSRNIRAIDVNNGDQVNSPGARVKAETMRDPLCTLFRRH